MYMCRQLGGEAQGSGGHRTEGRGGCRTEAEEEAQAASASAEGL